LEDKKYYFAKQVVDSGRYPFTMGQMRHLLLYRHRNGLDKVVIKVGKRLVFRMDLFDIWIDNQFRKK